MVNHICGSPSIAARLRRLATDQPHAAALTWISRDRGTSLSVNYAELVNAVSDYGRQVLAHHLDRPVRVALVASNRPETVVALLALREAGHVVLMLGPFDPEARRAQVVAAAGAAYVIDPAAPAGCEVVQSRVGVTSLDLGPADDPDRLALVFPTSGSTAASKLVAQSVGAVHSNARSVIRHHRLGVDVTVLGGLPVSHVNGLHFTVVGVLASGAHLVLPEVISVFDHLDLIAEHQVQIASVVPTVLDGLAELRGGWSPPETFRYFVSAAAPLQTRTVRRVWGDLGSRVLQGYGLSETTNFSTTMPTDLTPKEYEELVLRAERLSVGVASFEHQVAVFDEFDRPVQDGQVGELCMRGDGVMDGYLGNDEATADALRGGWFHSGDLGFMTTIAGRRFVHITGRLKNVAKVRGESVSMEEVERLALGVASVLDAGCITVPHDIDGETLILNLVAPESAVADVRLRLAESLPPLHRPSTIRLVASIPRTPTGKVLRPDLKGMVDQP